MLYNFTDINDEMSTAMNNTVIKTYEILKLIAQRKDGLTLAQIVKYLELPKSTTFNIVHTLEALGMLRLSGDTVPVYQLGIESLKIGLAYLNGSSLDAAARPVLSRLCHEANETTFLSVRSGTSDLVYVMKFLSDSEYQTKYSIGDVRPLLSLAMGKAMLSAMTDEEVRAIITPEMFSTCSIPSIADIDSLLDYLHKTRKLGYAIDATDENVHFASPVAAPILDVNSNLIGAISIVIMRDPGNADRIQKLGKMVNSAALEISRSMGYVGSDLFMTN